MIVLVLYAAASAFNILGTLVLSQWLDQLAVAAITGPMTVLAMSLCMHAVGDGEDV